MLFFTRSSSIFSVVEYMMNWENFLTVIAHLIIKYMYLKSVIEEKKVSERMCKPLL